MPHWEYCAVKVAALYREGSDPAGTMRELLTVRMPGANEASASHPFGLVGLLNQLGAEGWELVDAENGTWWMKRPAK